MSKQIAIFIFRRDLRLEDNIGLNYALENYNVIPIFIYNKSQIGNQNKFKSKRAITFMGQCLDSINEELKKNNKKLYIFKNDDLKVLSKIHEKKKISAIIENMDYTPFSLQRSEKIKNYCSKNNITYIVKEDYLLSKIGDLNKENGDPYNIFTPFKNNGFKYNVAKPKINKKLIKNFIKINFKCVDIILFNENMLVSGGRVEGLKRLNNIKNLSNYNEIRNNPNFETSLLSAYIKFGCLSIREVYWKIKDSYGINNQLLDQLFWREFYFYIVYYYPQVLNGKNFNTKYDNIKWTNNEENFEKWCNGTTGYPIVDAGMAELNQTGFMHNRLRLITANFLNRMLNIDWRKGEKYYANQLTDYDPSVNNGNWQWIASCGVDPKPYFQRLFNPILQSSKFDPQANYIKKWLPQLKDIPAKELHNWEKYYKNYDLNDINYVEPIVDYKKARQLSIETFRKVLS